MHDAGSGGVFAEQIIKGFPEYSLGRSRVAPTCFRQWVGEQSSEAESTRRPIGGQPGQGNRIGQLIHKVAFHQSALDHILGNPGAARKAVPDVGPHAPPICKGVLDVSIPSARLDAFKKQHGTIASGGGQVVDQGFGEVGQRPACTRLDLIPQVRPSRQIVAILRSSLTKDLIDNPFP